jgi:hypothetical protein
MPIFKKTIDKTDQKGYIIRCTCNDPEHDIEFSWWPDCQDKEIYIHYHIQLNRLSKRIVQSVKHIFGYKSKYGNVGEILLNKEELNGLITSLQEAQKDLGLKNDSSSDEMCEGRPSSECGCSKSI